MKRLNPGWLTCHSVSFLLMYSVILVICFAHHAVAQADVLQKMLQEYKKESSEYLPDELENRVAFFLRWRDRLQAVASQHRDSRYYRYALVKSLALSNSASDWNESSLIAAQLLSIEDEPSAQARWLGELGQIASYKVSDDSSSINAARLYFEKADDAYSQIKLTERTNKVRRRQYGNFIARTRLAMIEGDQSRIADAFRRARRFVEEEPSDWIVAGSRDRKLESLIYSEMISGARSGQVEYAKNALKKFIILNDTKWPPSFYSIELFNAIYPDRKEPFATELVNSIDDLPEDAWTAIAYLTAAEVYFDNRETILALGLYEKIRERYSESLLLASADAIQIGQGGYYATLLYDMGRIYYEFGDWISSQRYFVEFSSLFDKDNRFQNVKKFLKSLEILIAQDRDVQIQSIEDELHNATGIDEQALVADDPIDSTVTGVDRSMVTTVLKRRGLQEKFNKHSETRWFLVLSIVIGIAIVIAGMIRVIIVRRKLM